MCMCSAQRAGCVGVRRRGPARAAAVRGHACAGVRALAGVCMRELPSVDAPWCVTVQVVTVVPPRAVTNIRKH